MFANVAALIGGSALSNVNGALCQFQGFLLEMYVALPHFRAIFLDFSRGKEEKREGGKERS